MPPQAQDTFDSSDTDRSGRQLRYAQKVTFEAPLALSRGGRLPEVTVAFETYGTLNAARDNAVLICHALSGDSHVARHEEDDDPGWWDVLIGPGKPVDTNRYFVICPNILGGCRGTTGPSSVNPETQQRYGGEFPIITVEDIVRVQSMLIDHLGIDRLLAVIGGSLGGQMTLTWATAYSDRLAGAVAVATSPRLTSQALAFDIVGRNAIVSDPEYRGGQHYDSDTGPLAGLAIARMLGHITYLSREAMMQKFDASKFQPRAVSTEFETEFSVGSYLAYQGDRFGERFDANSYVTISMAMDLFDLGNTPEAMAASLHKARCRWLLISYSSDWLFPEFQSREIVDSLIRDGQPVSYCNVQSDCGHDAFLLPNNVDVYGELIRAFLANVRGTPLAGVRQDKPVEGAQRRPGHEPTSIFHRANRLDYDTIVELITPGASVLDLGCGTGALLDRLRHRGHERLMGVELGERTVLETVRRGFDVVQADLNKGLSAFPDEQFDFVVLSQTLQTVMDVQRVVNEMLRVGRQGIVSFPNLGFGKLRAQLAEDGFAPRGDATEGYGWYNTPNVRFLTIADFEQFCREQGINILERIALDTQSDRRVLDKDPNLFADVAVMVLSR